MRNAVGLSIRANRVEVLEVQRVMNGSVKAVRYGHAPLLSQEKPHIVAAIQQALESAKIKTKDVVLAIPTQEVVLRYFTLPLIPKSEWPGAVQFEARKYVPFKLEELVWDFHATERKLQRQVDVIFVATRHEVFQEYISLLTQAGLTAVAVEAASFSLARALRLIRPDLNDSTVAMIDAGGDTAHVALIHQGVPQLARDVFLMGRDELKPLATLLNPAVPPADIAAGHLPEDVIPEPPVAPSETEQQFTNLLSELKLSLDYFAREFGGQDVRQVMLCGEQATEAWRAALAQELKLPVELAQPSAVEGAATLSLAWMMVLGLALHGLNVPGPSVNFLRYGKQTATMRVAAIDARRGLGRALVWESVVAGLGLILLTTVTSMQLARQQATLVRLQQARAAIALPAPAQSLGELQALHRDMERRLALLESTVGSAQFVTPKLAALPRLLPEEVWLDTVVFRAPGVGASQSQGFVGSLGGLCMTGDRRREMEIINQLPERLRRDAQFADHLRDIQLAAVGSAKLAETEITHFELRVTAAPAGGGHDR